MGDENERSSMTFSIKPLGGRSFVVVLRSYVYASVREQKALSNENGEVTGSG